MAFKRFGKLVRRFGEAREGTVAIIAGLTALPMVMAVGMAIDLYQAGNIEARLQASLDAAALTAASAQSLSDAERVALAQEAFAQNWQDAQSDGMTATANFTIRRGGIVANATADMPTGFMQLAGFEGMAIGSDVEISIPERRKAEIVLVLDYSRSMTETSGGKVKYVAMREAAIKLVEDLSKAGPNRVKFGLVPFSHQVRVTLPKEFVLGERGVGSWTGCTQDRLYPHNVSDATPEESDDDTKWNRDVLTDHGGCGGYRPRNLTIRPLTSSFTAVTGQLASMLPYEYTHIALGVEFGWHLLSPNAPFGEGAAYGDEETDKFLVVLTDGRQTEPAFGRRGTRTDRNGETNLETLCEKVKDRGVTIVSIAYDLRDEPSTTDRLRDCASDPDKHFFIAESGEDVARAFEGIKAEIAQAMFISK